jgi:hypothetical protein
MSGASAELAALVYACIGLGAAVVGGVAGTLVVLFLRWAYRVLAGRRSWRTPLAARLREDRCWVGPAAGAYYTEPAPAWRIRLADWIEGTR